MRHILSIRITARVTLPFQERPIKKKKKNKKTHSKNTFLVCAGARAKQLTYQNPCLKEVLRPIRGAASADQPGLRLDTPAEEQEHTVFEASSVLMNAVLKSQH